MKLLINSTPLALWQTVVKEAAIKSGISLKEEIESYLVFLLMRYLERPDLIKQIIALDYLLSTALTTRTRLKVLQDVGDKCLLFSGLFPQIAEKRLVKVSYFVNMGQSAYDEAAHLGDSLFDSLAKHFVLMVDTLQVLHYYNELTPIQAYDLWNETSSQHALAMLKQCTVGIPINSNIKK